MSGKFSAKAAVVAVDSEDGPLIWDQSMTIPVPLRLHRRAARVVIEVGIAILTKKGCLAGMRLTVQQTKNRKEYECSGAAENAGGGIVARDRNTVTTGCHWHRIKLNFLRWMCMRRAE